MNTASLQEATPAPIRRTWTDSAKSTATFVAKTAIPAAVTYFVADTLLDTFAHDLHERLPHPHVPHPHSPAPDAHSYIHGNDGAHEIGEHVETSGHSAHMALRQVNAALHQQPRGLPLFEPPLPPPSLVPVQRGGTPPHPHHAPLPSPPPLPPFHGPHDFVHPRPIEMDPPRVFGPEIGGLGHGPLRGPEMSDVHYPPPPAWRPGPNTIQRGQDNVVDAVGGVAAAVVGGIVLAPFLGPFAPVGGAAFAGLVVGLGQWIRGR